MNTQHLNTYSIRIVRPPSVSVVEAAKEGGSAVRRQLGRSLVVVFGASMADAHSDMSTESQIKSRSLQGRCGPPLAESSWFIDISQKYNNSRRRLLAHLGDEYVPAELVLSHRTQAVSIG